MYGNECGYYDDIIKFMKDIFVSVFKGNLNLYKGVITGVLRVSKENMFSDANNITVYNITDSRFNNYFGFTEEEVKNVLDEYNLSDTFNDVKEWYDGYNFKNLTIYNPWSILNYLSNEDHELKPYWVNTGGVGLLRKLIFAMDRDLIDDYNDLLSTGYIPYINLDLYMDLKDLKVSSNTVWTLFMLAGYLTPVYGTVGEKQITLKIPNKEIEENLKSVCIDWFNRETNGNNMVKYLYKHNMDMFKEEFEAITKKSLSMYDVGVNKSENFYHAFSMGLLYSAIDRYDIKSNRESGLGRYDLVLIPKTINEYMYIIEFKKVREIEDFDSIIEAGFKQIEDKQYDIDYADKYKITKIVIAFRGKNCQVEIR